MGNDVPPILNRRRRWLLARLVANGLGQAAAAVATALLVELAFDRLIAAGVGAAQGRLVAWVGLGLAAATLATAALRARERVDAERLGQDYVHEVRLIIYARLATAPPRALQRRSQGSVLLRLIGDASAVRQWVSLGLARLVVAGVMLAAAGVALLFVNRLLAVALGGVVLVGAAGSLRFGRRLRAAAAEARRRRAYLTANLNQQVAALAVVQLFGQGERERRRVAKQSRRLRRASVARARVGGLLQGIAEGTGGLATGAVLVLGAVEVGAGRASPGTVVAAMAIVGLLVPPLRDLGRVEEYRQNARVAFAKLREFLAAAEPLPDEPGAPELAPGAGRLEFDRVRVDGALAGISAVAPAGSRVALVGPNGSGKSTLLALAARLFDPDDGTVRLDGQDLGGRSLASVRRAVGMVGPDLPLLRGTIGGNLRYRWPDAPEPEVARGRALCGVDELLAGLPDGERTRLSEGGRNLSVGQRQRIALARALLGGPRLLLLDEAEANLDPRAAALVDAVLESFPGTVLMATHRPERLAAADLVWHLAEGRLVEAGPPAAVLDGGGQTGRLFAPLRSTAAA